MAVIEAPPQAPEHITPPRTRARAQGRRQPPARVCHLYDDSEPLCGVYGFGISLEGHPDPTRSPCTCRMARCPDCVAKLP